MYIVSKEKAVHPNCFFVCIYFFIIITITISKQIIAAIAKYTLNFSDTQTHRCFKFRKSFGEWSKNLALHMLCIWLPTNLEKTLKVEFIKVKIVKNFLKRFTSKLLLNIFVLCILISGNIECRVCWCIDIRVSKIIYLSPFEV